MLDNDDNTELIQQKNALCTTSDFFAKILNQFAPSPVPMSFSQDSRNIAILNVLSQWVRTQLEDFEVNGQLRIALEKFLLHATSVGYNSETSRIKRVAATRAMSLARQRELKPSPLMLYFSPLTGEQNTNMFTSWRPPLGTSPNLLGRSPLLDTISAKDVAQYFSVSEMNTFAVLSVFDFLTNSPVITSFLERSERMKRWVIMEILSLGNAKCVRKLAEKFADVAKLCMEWQNLHTAFIIVSALNSSEILQRHKESLKDISRGLKWIELFMGSPSSHQSLLEVNNMDNIPTLPCLSTLFKDIQSIQNSYPEKIVVATDACTMNVFNWEKRAQLQSHILKHLRFAKLGDLIPSATARRISKIIKDLPNHSMAFKYQKDNILIPSRILETHANNFLSKLPLSLEATVVILESRIAFV